MSRTRVAVLISGNGSNLQALLDAAADPSYPAEIMLVISNIPTAYGLTRARAAGVATHIIPHTDHSTREAFDAALDQALQAAGIEFLCLAGFMRILTPAFAARWAGRAINIHPSLLPKFKGLNTHARALAANETEHGATVHWVTPELDSGTVIAQASTLILADDTVETLKSRVHALEHQLYPRALRLALETHDARMGS